MPYKIQDSETGLFSTGGSYPRWTKYGKTWHTLGHVKAALTLWRTTYRKTRSVPAKWDVVKFAITLEHVCYASALHDLPSRPPEQPTIPQAGDPAPG